MTKKIEKQKVLRMKQPIVENVPMPRESIFKLFPSSQLPYTSKYLFAYFVDHIIFRIFFYINSLSTASGGLYVIREFTGFADSVPM